MMQLGRIEFVRVGVPKSECQPNQFPTCQIEISINPESFALRLRDLAWLLAIKAGIIRYQKPENLYVLTSRAV